MKAKLGKLNSIKATKYSAYKALLKKEVIQALKNVESNNICNYVMVDSQYLSWGGDQPNNEQPLFYLGKIETWKKDIKANKEMDLKAYSFGQCKLVLVGTNIEIALCPEKGKLTQNTLLKPIKNIFKKFKPKIFFDVVGNLDDVESSTNDNIVLADNLTDQKVVLQKIGADLEKYHLAQAKLKKALAKAKSADKKEVFFLKHRQTLKRLKHLCSTWESEIAPKANELIVNKQSKSWEKIYAHWHLFFKQRKDAKAGDTTNQEAIKAEEERIYMKALSSFKQFEDNLEKGNLIDPSIIESNIESLEYHIKQWKKFTVQKEASFSKELASFEKKLEEINSSWKTLKPLTESYHSKSKELDKALSGDDLAVIQQLYKDLESISNQIVNLN